MRHVRRSGAYLRVADPTWRDPLSGEHARSHGGRWNAPGAFAVVYLNMSVDLARALVATRLEDRGIRPEDILPEVGPTLVHTTVPDDDYVDAVTEDGLHSAGLPKTYPLGEDGTTVDHAVCQPIGALAYKQGERGIACCSATAGAPADAEELAYFGRKRLPLQSRQPFVEWYF